MVRQLGTLTAVVIVGLYKFEIGLSLCPSTLYNLSAIFESDGICYELHSWSVKLPWDEANVKCNENNGQLAKIAREHYTSPQNSAMREYYSEHYGSHCLWVGMSDREEEGSWKWTDGTPVTGVKWEEMNWFEAHIMTRIWDCGALCHWHNAESLTWRKTRCEFHKGYICEYKALPPPTSEIPVMKLNKKKKTEGRRRRTRKSTTKTVCHGVGLKGDDCATEK